MQPKLFRVILPVSDIEVATKFYETVLGIEGKRVSPGRHYFDCEGTILACFDPTADGDQFDTVPGSEHIYLAVENLDESYKLVQSTDATFDEGKIHDDPAGEIATRPWGEKSFYFSDPFGNKLCFVDRAMMFVG